MTHTVRQLAEVSRQVAAAFDARERRPWSLETPGYQAGSDRVANELADILYCVLRIADHCQIDLAEARSNSESIRRTDSEGQRGRVITTGNFSTTAEPRRRFP